ncbi:hypothetical protein JTE90_009709 [Oedothorax gibbosus]|uniref:Uncharacterized protein n=1 Tax=Oedothorax gibbosus TaxID=931172 RepID=A0AAV6V8S1_9ARAC|nr:hypothetical protein JTE90_009709 [Oedothorax gibbosus]
MEKHKSSFSSTSGRYRQKQIISRFNFPFIPIPISPEKSDPEVCPDFSVQKLTIFLSRRRQSLPVHLIRDSIGIFGGLKVVCVHAPNIQMNFPSDFAAFDFDKREEGGGINSDSCSLQLAERQFRFLLSMFTSFCRLLKKNGLTHSPA